MTKEEIIKGFRSTITDIISDVNTCTETEFYAIKNEKWSAAVNFAHLTLSAKVVARGLAAPKIALWLKFGRQFKRESVSYDAIVEKYLIANAIPRSSPTGFEPRMSADTTKAFEIKQFTDIHDKLISTLSKWTEKQLDTYLIPHPLMGKITVRELLCFLVYHIKHHQKAVLIALDN
jgi:DinB superfamily